MRQRTCSIGDIPALLWGGDSDRCILAVHGRLSHKADRPAALLAETACPAGIRC